MNVLEHDPRDQHPCAEPDLAQPDPGSELDPDAPYLAIVGMAGRFPGASSPEALWRTRDRISIHRFTDAELAGAGIDAETLRHPDYVRARGILDDVAGFDAAFFGIGARAAETMDPQQRLFLETAWEAFENAGYDPARVDGAVGVFAGCGVSTYLLENLLPNRALVADLDVFELATRNAPDYLATLIAYKLDLEGPALTVQTACSTSLVAVHLAGQALLAGECDMALAGGVSVPVPQVAGYRFLPGGIHAPDGQCRPFDAAAAGTVQGTGAGIVVLKRLADAQADGDRIRAVILGSAINNDGADKAGLTAPSIKGQAAVVAEAHLVAGVDARSIGFVETHGTATQLGDPIELAALSQAFRRGDDNSDRAEIGDGQIPDTQIPDTQIRDREAPEARAARSWCALGALKANIGHLDSAAGVAGLIRTVLALEHGEIPPHVSFTEPNPRLALVESPFRIPSQAMPWPRIGTVDGGRAPRRAGVSSFGFGGTNAHVVLQEAPAATGLDRSASAAPQARLGRPWQILPVSARTPSALAAACERLADHLAPVSDGSTAPNPAPRDPAPSKSAVASLADAAWTLQVGRRAFDHRHAVVARDHASAASSLRAHAEAIQARMAGEGARGAAQADGVVFLFPGQGAQSVGMGHGLYRTESVYRRTVDACLEVAASHLDGEHTRALETVLRPESVEPGGAEASAPLAPGDEKPADSVAARALASTAVTQPALFIVEWALATLLRSCGITPKAVLGHSLGEIVAATVAGVLDRDSALRLVIARGTHMASLPLGEMIAVSMREAEIGPLLALGGGALDLAAVNAPGAVSVAGTPAAMAVLIAELDRRQVAWRRLATDRAFHSSMMDSILAPIEALAAELPRQPATVPWLSALDGAWMTPASATSARYWAQQLRQPVRFADALERLLPTDAEVAPVFLEVGPGGTLSSFVRRATRGASGGVSRQGARRPKAGCVRCLPGGGDAHDDVALRNGLAHLWTRGIDIDWQRLHEPDLDEPDLDEPDLDEHEPPLMGARRQRVPLPTYPFERHRYWIDPPSRQPVLSSGAPPTDAAAANQAKAAVDAAGAQVPLWQQAPWMVSDAAAKAVRDASWWVVGLASSPKKGSRKDSRKGFHPVRWVADVVAGLQGLGARSVASVHLDNRAGRHRHAATLRAQVEAGGPPTHVIDLRGCWPLGEQTDAGTEAIAFAGGLALLQALAEVAATRPMPEPPNLLLVASGAVAVLDEPVLAGRAALRALAGVHAGVRCRMIDVDGAARGERAASGRGAIDRLLAEAALGEAEVVAHRGTRRWVQQWGGTSLPVEAAARALEPQGCYLVAGGLGNLGWSLVEALVVAGARRLAILDDQVVPPAAPLAGEAAPLAREDALAALDAMEQRVRRRLPIQSLTAVPHLQHDLDQLCALRVCEALAALDGLAEGDGLAGLAGQPELLGQAESVTLTLEAAAERHAVADEHRRLYRELWEILAEDGTVSLVGDRLTVPNGVLVRQGEIHHARGADSSSGAKAATLAASLGQAEPALVPLIEMVDLALARYPRVLRGELPAVAVLHGEAEGLLHETRETIAQRWTGARALMLAGELLVDLAACTPRPLRILEVGGGRGGFTLPVLAALTGHAVDYHFTDLGASFVAEARAQAERLGLVGRDPQGEEHSGLRFSTFDIAAEPTAQGVARDHYDAVLGLDVVHATADVPETVQRLRELLLPGGLLLLVESSQTPRWANLLWGLEKGWWDYADDLRVRSPLMPPDVWEEALRGSGYGVVGAFPRDAEARAISDAALVVGQRPFAPAASDSPRDRIADLVAAEQERQRTATGRLAALAAQGVDVVLHTVSLADRQAVDVAVAASAARLGPLRGVVHAPTVPPGAPIVLASPAAVRREGAVLFDGACHLGQQVLASGGDLFVVASAAPASDALAGVSGRAARMRIEAIESEARPRVLLVPTGASSGRIARMLASAEPVIRDLSAAPNSPASESENGAGPDAQASQPSSLPMASDAPRSDPGSSDSVSVGSVSAGSVSNHSASTAAAHPRPAMDTAFRAPSNPLEERVAALWRRFLAIDPVGMDDDILVLGGDSLVSTQIATALRATLETEDAEAVPIRDLLSARTVAEMTGCVAAAMATARSSDAVAAAPGGALRGTVAGAVEAPPEEDAPLTSGQRRLWFLARLDPASPAYNVPVALDLTGDLDTEAMRRSVQAIVARHAVLRTRFVELEAGPESEPGTEEEAGRKAGPRQRIDPETSWPLPVHDLRSADDPAAELERQLADEVRRPFDLAAGPVLRTVLWRLADQRFVMALTMHHAVTDGWSLAVLMNEVAAHYRAFRRSFRPAFRHALRRLPDAPNEQTLAPREPTPDAGLPPLPIQVADVARQEQQVLASPAMDARLARWRARLEGLPILDLPTDRPRPASPTWSGAQCPVVLPVSLVERARTVARERGVTLFMLLLAAFEALLARWSGQTDFAIGTVIANRLRPDLEPLIGYFANSLPLRVDLGGDPSGEVLLERVRAVAEDAYADQEIPFERLVEALSVSRDTSRTPLFQVLFILQNTPSASMSLPDLSLRRRNLDAGTTRFDLTLSLGAEAAGSEGGALVGVCEYSTDLFDAGTIERLVGHYQTLLEGLVTDPSCRLSALPLLGGEERASLAPWNATKVGWPGPRTIPELFRRQAARTPDAVALVGFDPADTGLDSGPSRSGGHLTYAALAARVARLARRLSVVGVGPEVRVGICLERSPELIVALLAVLEAGGAFVPLDPEDPEERLSWIARDAAVACVVTDARSARRLPRTLATTARIEVGGPEEMDVDRAGVTLWQPLPIDPANLAYVIYTSGSTGRPKGAMNAHAPIVNRLLWMQQRYALDADDRVLQKTPMSFDVSVWEFFWPLIVGARLVLAEPGGHRDGAYLVERIRSQAVTTIHFVPSMLEAFLTAPAVESCTSLVRILASGEALSQERCARLRACLPATELHNLYGPTEAALDVTAWQCHPTAAGEAESAAAAESSKMASVPIGHPIANLRIHLLDRHLGAVPVGVVGELYIAGVGVGRGYLGQPARTAERFVPDVDAETPGARMYRSGDQARRRPDGAIVFDGRIDGQVKIRGVRIEPGEVEACLRHHSAIRDVAVVARPNAAGHQLVAYWVPSPASDASEGAAVEATQQETTVDALRGHVAASLPAAMVPTRFVALDALPNTASGKLDRRALPEPGAIEPSSASDGAPRTADESTLVAMFAAVLGQTSLGVEDDFFALGGHSLLAAQVIARIRATLGIEVPLRELFAAPTAVALAGRLRALRAAALPPIRPLASTSSGDAPSVALLSPSQKRLWFLDRLAPGNPAYNIPLAFDLDGAFDLDAMAAALREVVRRHQILRTRYIGAGGTPRAEVLAARPVPLPVSDLAALDSSLRKRAATRVMAWEAHRAFDLMADVLLRARVVRLAPDHHRLLLTLHHMAADGWSLGVLMDELTRGYRARQGAASMPGARLDASGLVASGLDVVPIQYRDWVAWQQERMAAADITPAIDFWQQTLVDWRPLDLGRRNDPAVGVVGDGGGRIVLTLDATTSSGLRDAAREAGASRFMTLLACFGLVLHQRTGHRLLVIGTPVAQRPRPELERLIGLFLDTVPIALRIDPDQPFDAYLRATKDAVLTAFAHQDVPFDSLVDGLGIVREGARPPLVETMLTVHNTPRTGDASANLSLPDVVVTRVDTATDTSKLDLTLNAVEEGETIALLLEYKTDLFDHADASLLVAQFAAIATAIAAAARGTGAGAPARSCGELIAEADATVQQQRIERLQAKKRAKRSMLRRPRAGFLSRPADPADDTDDSSSRSTT